MEKEMILEFKRKGLHLLAILLPISMLFFSFKINLISLIFFTSSSILIDLLRVRNSAFSKIYGIFFGSILREHEEKGKFTGATFFFISLMASFLLFHMYMKFPIKIIVTIYVAFMLGDASAALIGKFYGKVKIYKSKTIGGFLACFITGLFVSFVILGSDIFLIFIISLLISLLELFVDKLDDNLVVPFFTLLLVSVIL